MNDKNKNIYILIVSNTFFGLLPILVKVANQFHYLSVEESFFRFVFGADSLALCLSWVTLRPCKPPLRAKARFSITLIFFGPMFSRLCFLNIKRRSGFSGICF